MGLIPGGGRRRFRAAVQGGDPDPEPVALANITALRSAGWDVPDPSEWWIEHPTAAEIKAALIAPYLNDSGGDGICIKRLMIPHTMTTSNTATDQPYTLMTLESNPADKAAMAWRAKDISLDDSAFDTKMAAAKVAFLADSLAHPLDAILALDWIVWDDADEFETAFAIAENITVTGRGGTDTLATNFFNEDSRGYYYNDTHTRSVSTYRTSLALSVYGINPSGASHAWAEGILNDLGPEVEAGVSAHSYSPFHGMNVLSLLSLGLGGGTEMGDVRHPYSNYEYYYAYIYCYHAWLFDTATGGDFSIRDKCLYAKTRHKSAVLQEDQAIHDTASASTTGAVKSILDIMSRTLQDGELEWIQQRNSGAGGYTGSTGKRERFFAGPRPTATAPASGPIGYHTASRFHYRSDQSTPESGLRFRTTCRTLEHARYGQGERNLYFAFNDVGLVEAGANRNAHVAMLANGLHLSKYDPTYTTQPYLTDSAEFWASDNSHHPYWSDDAVQNPSEIVEDSKYLLTSGMFSEDAGVWTWENNYTSKLTKLTEIGIVGKVALAKAEYTLTPAENKLEIIDTIQADSDVYAGWHFSPNFTPSLITDGFEFTDGTDVIRVLVEPLDGMSLVLTQRDSIKTTGGSDFDLDYYGPELVAKNMGYAPSVASSQYRARVTIQANPS